MGSSSSKKIGGMIISFDKPYYYTGDEVNGYLNLNLFDKAPLSKIEIDLSVIEYNKFLDKEGDFNPHNHMKHLSRDFRHHHSKNGVVREGRKTLLKNYGYINTNNLSKGQYVFPFYFSIPMNLPGSFEYYDKDNVAYIMYVITARMVIPNYPENDLIHDTILMVRQSPQYFEYPNILTTTKNLTSICFDKGTTTFQISYAKHFFSPDEVLQVICDIDNTNCSLNARSIKLELFQRIYVKDNQMHSAFITRKLAEQRYDGFYVRLS